MMPVRWTVLPASLFAALAVACGSDGGKPLPDDPGGGAGGSATGDAGTTDSPCKQYCGAITGTGADCAHYNDADHCYLVCDFYYAGVCVDAVKAFTDCVKSSSSIACFQPSSTSKVGLVVPQECNAVYDAFKTCINDHDAGVCPYGSL